MKTKKTMTKSKWFIVNVDSPYWPEYDDPKSQLEFLVKAPDRIKALELTRKHFYINGSCDRCVYCEDFHGHESIIADPSLDKQCGSWLSIHVKYRMRDQKGHLRYKYSWHLLFASKDNQERDRFIRKYFQKNDIDWVEYYGFGHSLLQGVLDTNNE